MVFLIYTRIITSDAGYTLVLNTNNDIGFFFKGFISFTI